MLKPEQQQSRGELSLFLEGSIESYLCLSKLLWGHDLCSKFTPLSNQLRDRNINEIKTQGPLKKYRCRLTSEMPRIREFILSPSRYANPRCLAPFNYWNVDLQPEFLQKWQQQGDTLNSLLFCG